MVEPIGEYHSAEMDFANLDQNALLLENLRDSNMQNVAKISRLADILPLAIKGLVGNGLDALVGLRQQWPDIAGEALARRSQVTGLRDGVLHVVVENSVTLNEMRLRRPELLTRLRKLHPDKQWQDIRLRLGA